MKIETFTLNLEYEETRDNTVVYVLRHFFGISRVAVDTYLNYFKNDDRFNLIDASLESEGIQKW